MAPMDPMEDVCRVCGKHLGYGLPDFHLGLCEEHSDYDDDSEEDEDS